jgi:glycosyltransferase involved in cell wall biosynthesis
VYVIAHNGAASLGGGELSVVSLLHGLQGRGHRVLMLCRDRAMAQRLAAYGVPTAVLHVGGTVMLHDALRLALLLRRERPDAVLLTTFKKLTLAGMAARLARVPRVVQRIGLETDRPARGVRYRWALRRLVDAVVVNADSMRGPFLLAAPGHDPANVVTIYHGPRLRPPSREGEGVRRELGIPLEARVVGAVARLARQKRFDRLLRALATLPDDVHCLLAGEGGERPAIEALTAELGLGSRVHFAGFRRDVADLLGALDVYVVCSDREGMSNAMLEAMASGLPVVSTRVSGADEALAPFADGSRPGEVVERDDELAPALRRLLDDPAARRAMGEAGRRRIAERFGFEQMLDAWEAVLGGGVR